MPDPQTPQNPLADLGGVIVQNPLADLGGVPTVGSSGDAKTPPPPQVWHELADDLKEGAIGAGKATARTTANLLKVADWILGGGSAPAAPVLDYIKSKIGEPTGTAQKVGAGLADVGAAMLPAGEIGKAADVAEGAVAAGGPVARGAARVLTQAGAGAATAAVQGADPTTGAIAGGGAATVGAAADALAPMVRSSAAKTMIRALGPPGGRGPTSDINLAAAEKLAPELVDQGFGAMTQAGARAKAVQAVKDAGNDLKSVLMSPAASADFDQPALLQKIQNKRASMLVDPATAVRRFFRMN